ATTIGWTDGNATDLWTDPGNWAGGVVPNAVGQTASFGSAFGTGSVNMNGSKTVSGLIFNNGGMSFDIFGSGALTIDNGSAVGAVNVTAVNVANGALVTTSIAQTSGINVTGSGRLTANGAISGAGSLVASTTGAVSLGASNSYSGGTQINAGTVTLNAVGALPANSALAVNGGTLDLNAKNISINDIQDNGTAGGVITNNGA